MSEKLRKLGLYNVEEIITEYEKEKKDSIQKALDGKATWGAWHYNPNNLTLEFDSKLSGYPKNDSYYVDLEQCNNSNGILDLLVHLLEKPWCPKEQIGYLLQAIAELSGDVYKIIWNRHFNMSKHLREMRLEAGDKVFTVDEVAKTLHVSKITVYRKVKADKIKAIRLPQGRFGDLRISEAEVKRLISENNATKK
jgi:excisionase family DNA binding protein